MPSDLLSPASLALRPRELSISANGLRHRVRVWDGTGPACVFLHGFAETGCVWEDVAADVRGPRRALALDLRGHGGTEWAPGAYELEDFVEDLAALLATLDTECFVLIGHSMGAGVALRLAERRLKGLRGLVLVDWATEARRHGLGEVVAMAREGRRTFRDVSAYAAWLAQARPFAQAQALAQLARDNARPVEGGVEPRWDPALFEAYRGYRDSEAAWAAIRRINAPWLLVRGRASSVLSPQVAQRMVLAAPNGRLVTVDRAGHGVMLDNPRAFAQVTAEFVAALT